jgi:hypothetical protein
MSPMSPAHLFFACCSVFFWTKVESAKSFVGQPASFREQAMSIYSKYIAAGAATRLNIEHICLNPSTATHIRSEIEMWFSVKNPLDSGENIPVDREEIYFGVFNRLQQEVFTYLKSKHYDKFLGSTSYENMILKYHKKHNVDLKDTLKTRRWIVALFASLLEKYPNEIGNLLLYMNIRRRDKHTDLLGHATNVFHQHIAHGSPFPANGISSKVRARVMFDLVQAEVSVTKDKEGVSTETRQINVEDIDEVYSTLYIFIINMYEFVESV